jgi:Tfp pilus assembly protein PilO
MLGLSAVFIFILAQYVCIPFYNSEMEIREKIQLLELTNEKYNKILEKRNDVVSKLNQLKRKESKTSNQLLLKGETTSLAAAEMQKMLEKLSSSSDIELKRVKVKESKEIGDFLTIPVELRFTTDLKKMTDFLNKIKNSNKLITISRFRIRVRRRRDPKLLIVTMWANGFMEQPT